MAGPEPTLPRLSLLLAATVTLLRVSATPPRVLADSEITVTEGDTLTAIALTYLGDPAQAASIAAYNQLIDPYHLLPGQVLRLPERISGSSEEPAAGGNAGSSGSERRAEPQAQAAAPRAGPVIQSGLATWYGPGFDGRVTRCGHVFHETDLTASSNDLPCGTVIEVTNMRNGRSVVVTVDDTGGFQHPTILDLSRAAFSTIESPDMGVVQVSVARIASARAGTTRLLVLPRPE
jgi:rare lipoprotein A